MTTIFITSSSNTTTSTTTTTSNYNNWIAKIGSNKKSYECNKNDECLKIQSI